MTSRRTVVFAALTAIVVLFTPLLRADAPPPPTSQPAVIKIACVGDSITFGAGLKDRHTESYPSQLQQMLGEQRYRVENFGVSGATLLKKGDRPYRDQRRFAAAKDFAPDVVVIKLGTNDSKPQNWAHKEEFHDDLTDLVKTFRGLPNHPTVWLCRPVPAFSDRWTIRDSVIKGEIIPIIDTVAREQKVKEIDLYAALSGKKDLFPDDVHPNAEGARLIAGKVFHALTGHALPTTARATDVPASAPSN